MAEEGGGLISTPTAATFASSRFRLLGIFYWFCCLVLAAKLVLAPKQRIESIRRILSSEGAKEFTEVSRLRMQDLETALKRFILNILTTTTYKEESEGAILEKLIRAACKPQASPQGKQ